MPNGDHRPPRPERDRHFPNFDQAMADALRNWDAKDGTELTVTLRVSISPNPGGVSQYRVQLA